MLAWLFGDRNAALIAKRRAERDALIDQARKLLGSHDAKLSEQILSSNIESLVKGIEQRTFTAKTVLEVFIRQAIVAHEETNCLTEVNFEAALQRAEELDQHFTKTGTLVGRLHGVPFSLKDHYALKGKHSSTGYSEWFKKDVEKEDCTFAQVVCSQGAICIAKTNVPQTMLNFECRNPAWGQTTNPYSNKHTCGGSSGGEAALLSVGGAAFGYGSDIGGSLRIPTAYCGIYAIKPSNGRSWPRTGNIDIGPAPSAIQSVAGPMCRSVADLEYLTRVCGEALCPPSDSVESYRDVQRRFGPSFDLTPAYPLRTAWFDPINAVSLRSPDEQTIRIGYYACDGFTKTSPACLRALDVALDALRSVNGTAEGKKVIELVEISPKKLQTFHIMRSFVGLTAITGYEHLKRPLGPDSIDWALKLTLVLPGRPWLRWFVGCIARFILGDRQLPRLFAVSNKRKADKYFAFEYETQKLRRAFERDVWHALRLDAIVCPVQASPALPHYGTTLLAPLAASTILYNVLGNPATVVPVARVNAALEGEKMITSNVRWNAQSGHETCSSMVADNLRKQYDAVKQNGLPLAVQIVTPDYEDERAIGLAKLLDDALAAQSPLHRQSFGPGAWQRYAKG